MNKNAALIQRLLRLQQAAGNEDYDDFDYDKGRFFFFPTLVRVKGAVCAQVKRLRVSYNRNDETLSRNSLRYLSKANLTIAVN